MRVHLQILSSALTALRRNVMRSALTCLGIIIGVAAVIAMMEIGGGSSAAIATTIASMGANNLVVQPGTAASGGVSFGAGSVMTLTPQDADAIARDGSSIRAVAPVVRARSQVVYGNKNWVPLYIYGTTPNFLDVRDWTTLDRGEPFTDRDVRNASKVCLIGQTIARELFGSADPIGKDVRVQNVSFRVVGVLATKGANMMGMDQDDILLAPWTTIKYRVAGQSVTTANQSDAATPSATDTTVNSLASLYPNTVQSLYPTVSETQAVNPAIDEINSVLRERHRIHTGDADDFSVRDLSEMTAALSSTTSLMTRLLLCVALISLVVGGVGIMNIMLVSVTERTREIGLRMAVGARGRDILQQFLTEAVLLCLLGGTIGILLGRGGSLMVRWLLGWPTQLSIPAIVAAFAVSAGTGIVFGYYPAWKAARLDPIEALRYE